MTVQDALAKACDAYLDLMHAVRHEGGELPLIESHYAERDGDAVSVKLRGSPREMPGHPYPKFEFPRKIDVSEYTVGAGEPTVKPEEG